MSGLARDAFSVTIDFSIMLFALFFFYKDGGHLFRRLYDLLPLEERHKQKVFIRLDTGSGAVTGTTNARRDGALMRASE